MTEVGLRVGPYELLEPIGAGGMGEVWRARDSRLGREVALKLLPARVATDPDRLRRFEQEARATGALDHPNVLAVHDLGIHEGAPYLACELLAGETLRSRLARGPLAPRKAAEIAAQVARGLAAAHDKGIVHRDLKPDNLFVTADGRVKILDFGLAKLTVDSEASGPTLSDGTVSGAVLGSVGYMAPEQVRGKPADARSDLFALGAVLHEMLTGARAFSGDTSVEIGYATLNHDPPEIAGVSPALAGVVRRCMEKAPGERFQSALDLAFALEALNGDSGNGGRAPPLADGPARRWMVPAALAAAVILAAAGGWWARGSGRPDRAQHLAPPSVSAPAPASGPAIRRLRRLETGPEVEDWPVIAPDGSWLVYQAEAANNHTDIFSRRVDGRAATNLTADSPEDDVHPAISPDGRRIAFRSGRQGGGVFVMSATGESVRRLTDFGFHPTWSPDGLTIAISTAQTEGWRADFQSRVHLVDAETGQARELPTGEDATLPSFAPDGRSIAYMSRERSIHVRGIAGGRPRTVVTLPAPHFLWGPTWAPDGRHVYFLTNALGTFNIARAAVGGSPAPPEPVTVGHGLVFHRPSFTRDGRAMLFDSRTVRMNILRAQFDARAGRLMGPPQRLTRGANVHGVPDVSPDGEWVVSALRTNLSDRDCDLVVMRGDGTGLRHLTDAAGCEDHPRFGRDGRRIFFHSCNREAHCQLFRIELDGSGLTQLSHRSHDTIYPVPSPVDSTVAATARGGGSPLLFDGDRPLDAQDAREIPRPPSPGSHFIPYRWTPDGAELFGYLIDPSERVSSILAYSPAQRSYREVVRADGDPDLGAYPLRDGRRALLERTDRMFLLDLASGRQELLLSLVPELMLNAFAVPRDERWIYFSTIDDEADLWLAELE